MIVRGMRGLGDNIYQRAFVKPLQDRCTVYLDTPWPQLYSDLPNVRFIHPVTQLRTQRKNLERFTSWSQAPRHTQELRIAYGSEGILRGMRGCFRVPHGEFDLPDFGPPRFAQPYVVVRPVTIRKEWVAETRNPLPEYVAQAAAHAAALGYRVVSVADLADGHEWALGLPPAHDRFHAGELGVEQLLALIQGAAAVIGPIGWIVPAAIAANVPAWVICGGQGGFNSPANICSQGTRVSFAVPDNFCKCKLKQHDCDKRISNHENQFAQWAVRHLPVV